MRLRVQGLSGDPPILMTTRVVQVENMYTVLATGPLAPNDGGTPEQGYLAHKKTPTR